MKLYRGLLLSLISCAIALPVAAQDEPPAPPVVAEQGVEDEQPWALYRAAFEQCARGERAKCEQTLRDLSSGYPEHRAGRLATDTLAGIKNNEPMPQPPPRRNPVIPQDATRIGSNGEAYTGLARAELITAQTAHGIVLGGELCAQLECDDARLIVGTMMLTGLGGLGLSWYASRDGMTPGHSVALNSGTVWGAVNAGLITSLSTESSDNFPFVLMAGQIAGLGLGQLYYMGARPTAGQVSLVNSGGIWSLVGFALAEGIFEEGLSGDAYTTGMLVAMDAGLLAGGALAHLFPMSRSRALLLDTGGLAGVLTGMGLYVLITNDTDDQGFFTSALLGTGLGIATAAVLTRDWDDDGQDQASAGFTGVSLVPGDAIAPIAGERQGGWGVSAGWRW